MTYRVYIRNNSNAEIGNSILPLQLSPLHFTTVGIVAALFAFSFLVKSPSTDSSIVESSENPSVVEETIAQTSVPKQTAEIQIIEVDDANPNYLAINHTSTLKKNVNYPVWESEPEVLAEIAKSPAKPEVEKPGTNDLPALQPDVLAREVDLSSEEELLGVLAKQNERQMVNSNRERQNVTIKKGDSMAIIFNKLSLGPGSLHKIMNLGEQTAILKSIKPGEIIQFEIEDGRLYRLSYDYSLTKTLLVTRNNDSFSSEIIETEIEKRLRYASAEIESSLFLAGQRAGITDKVIMNLVSIYGWDIDFALDIRSGDKFAILFEEHFKEGKKINNGPILAAEFINQGHKFRAVRYTHDNGDINYYSDSGHNMRKAFMRTPVNFSRISSRFNLKRKHPVLNTIRAHKGVDYAARTGTPIKATGDGIVSYKGKKGGYGRTVILKHGGTYTTLYAHMSKYAKGISTGTRVKQGQIIGYVGKSGLATGPHLHYEFRINGVHRNPLKVKLPKALKIPDTIMADFKKQTQPILAQLDQYISQADTLASLPIAETDTSQILAMRKTDESPQSLTQ